MGIVLAKDWPIGEPPGIKIVNDDTGKIPDGRPTNCIMATSYLDGAFLDSTDPQQVLCSGPFQSHKRFKVAMLPTTVADGAGFEEGIDLVFDVEAEAGSRDYQVFQKINNWTDGRLDGFTIEVGTGIGTDFVPASDAGRRRRPREPEPLRSGRLLRPQPARHLLPGPVRTDGHQTRSSGGILRPEHSRRVLHQRSRRPRAVRPTR